MAAASVHKVYPYRRCIYIGGVSISEVYPYRSCYRACAMMWRSQLRKLQQVVGLVGTATLLVMSRWYKMTIGALSMFLCAAESDLHRK